MNQAPTTLAPQRLLSFPQPQTTNSVFSMKAALVVKIWYYFLFSCIQNWLHSLQLRPIVMDHARLKFGHCWKKNFLSIFDHIISLVTIHVDSFSNMSIMPSKFNNPASS